MATCDNCGHNQSDFLSTDDIEAIQLRSITLDGRCQTLENENASLKAMLKTQSDRHQQHVQELLNGYEEEIQGIKRTNSTKEADGLRAENEILKSSVFELNLKLRCTENLIRDLKDKLDASLAQTKRDKELMKDDAALISELEDRLKEALDNADKLREMATVRNNKDDSGVENDMILQKQLEESFGNSLERVKKVFSSAKESPLCYTFNSAEDSSVIHPLKSANDLSFGDYTEESSDTFHSSEESSSAESSSFSSSSNDELSSPDNLKPRRSLCGPRETDMVKKESEEASCETANEESDIEVVDMTDEIRDLVF